MRGAAERILIINADDLGYTRGINQAVQQCFAAGMLRSATLMANGFAFDDAVAVVSRIESPDVGVHLVLTELPPVSPASRIQPLLNDRGRLPGSPRELAVSLLGGKAVKDAVRQELDSQISKVLDHGLRPTHLDSHKHVHAMPPVLEVVLELADRFSIPWIRNPFDETPFFQLAPLVDKNRILSFCLQHLKAKAIAAFRSNFLKLAHSSGIRLSDHFYGISLTGIWNEAAMLQLIHQLPPGITEWMVHPGNCDPDLLRSDPRLSEHRERERDLLMSSSLREQFAAHGIGLSSFGAED